MQRQAKLLVVMLVVLAFVVACTANLNIKPISEMTPKEKSLAVMKIYNMQVDSYKTRLALPDLSPAEKRVLNTEYLVFQKTWYVIKAYDDYVQGVTPTIDDAIIQQINQLISTYRY